MINFIIGNIVEIEEEFAIIQNNNIGYKVFSSKKSLSELELGSKDQMIYTKLDVRDDGLFLFGFTSKEEMDMYNLLVKVSKIGPKTGVAILSHISPNRLKIAIMNKDIATLCEAPGVGKKTAERMILELKDKIDYDIELEMEDTGFLNDDYNEAVEALVSLGYTKYEIEKSSSGLDIKNMKVEEIIREVLKKLSK